MREDARQRVQEERSVEHLEEGLSVHDGTYLGITTCCRHKNDEDNPEFDIHNPDPKKRGRATTGIVLIWHLTCDEDGEYSDGYVYNPRDGKTYRMNVKLIDLDTLKIRGFLGIPLLGQTQTWKRVHKEPAS